MYHANCLCGTIKYEIRGEIKDIVCCHCSQCRKAQGSAFATNANVADENFHLISGKDSLTQYKESPTRSKFFCKHCGSPLFAKVDALPGKTRIRLGLIQEDITQKITGHIFTTSKANWETIPNDAPHYEQWKK